MRSPRTATKSSPRSPQLEKAHVQQRRPNAAAKKKKFSICTVFQRGKKGGGENTGNQSFRDWEFKCKLHKEWAAGGGSRVVGTRGYWAVSPRSRCYLSVCTYIYMSIYVSIMKESCKNYVDFNFMT